MSTEFVDSALRISWDEHLHAFEGRFERVYSERWLRLRLNAPWKLASVTATIVEGEGLLSPRGKAVSLPRRRRSSNVGAIQPSIHQKRRRAVVGDGSSSAAA
ncbi:hypothetical protein [Protofrankia symbiont of Coriaria ruscifolia]|uniref:hypothetical protein n=1 Tax=Protofrankia symbiont of Coriaria ruscifolia TaxID=1306542 RepID=UPI001041B886|nr:hypothetical protein [Protofrankia symbiont of Coriaria ruscifolia]